MYTNNYLNAQLKDTIHLKALEQHECIDRFEWWNSSVF